jgi:hypothetical protein
MHTAVLLAIATETYGIVVAEYLFHAIDKSTLSHLQLAQDAVVTDYQLGLADLRLYPNAA